MNPEILHFIFNSFPAMLERTEAQKIAKGLGFTMFQHNGIVYSTSDQAKLFSMDKLIK